MVIGLAHLAAYLSAMPAYRFYTLSRADEPPVERTFYNDRVAMSWAFKAAGADGVEIWQGTRFVGRLHAGAQPGSLAQTIE